MRVLQARAMESGAREYILKLFIAGRGPRSLAAIQNLQEICDQYLKDRYSLTIVDILEHPDQAESARIIATPTLLLDAPHPGRRIVGDLSVTDRVLVGLGLRQHLWTWRRGMS